MLGKRRVDGMQPCVILSLGVRRDQGLKDTTTVNLFNPLKDTLEGKGQCGLK